MRLKNTNVIARNYQYRIEKCMQDGNLDRSGIITTAYAIGIKDPFRKYANHGFKILERYYRMRGYRVNAYSLPDSREIVYMLKIHTRKLKEED